MTELRIGDQTIRYDRVATARAYAGLACGFVEKCGCVDCRNFSVQRGSIYPASFRALLEQLDIDPDKELVTAGVSSGGTLADPRSFREPLLARRNCQIDLHHA